MKKLLPILLLISAACDRELVCPAGETDCGGRCVSLLTDRANCGGCGNDVGPLGDCVDGATVCASDIDVCGVTCTDLARDPDHCGGCDVACPSSQLCATVGGATSCTEACPIDLTACGRACVDTLTDRFHCGACGHACPGGQVCTAGGCRPDVVVACYSTNEVVPVTAALAPAGDARATPSGPTSIAVHGEAVYSANGYPQASVSVLPLDPSLPSVDVAVAGDDLEHVAVVDGVVVVGNASIGTLLFFSPSGTLLGELALPEQTSGPNPRGFAIAGATAYVALYGSGPDNGQAIAKVELSGLSACLADPLGTPCGTVLAAETIDLLAVPGSYDAPGLPFPSSVAEAGGRIYVALANLKEASFSCGDACTYTAWAEPAGNGRLAVIDPADGDAVSIVDLGAGCGNPGAMALDGTTLWVACGSWGFPTTAPGVLVPVSLASGAPVVGAPLDLAPILPGGLAFCGGLGYATDQSSGAVVRFDPIAGTVEAPVTVCAMGPYGYAWASDVACGR